MHKPNIAGLVYSYLFPKPTDTDPSTFSAFTNRCIVPEVRSEVLCFYGPQDCLESRYPGLDYSNPAHRLRLSRFPHHKRIFQAFDALRLTKQEIHVLCRWEGTKCARERYERDEGVKIRDTTWDEILPLPPKQMPTSTLAQLAHLRGGEYWHATHASHGEHMRESSINAGEYGNQEDDRDDDDMESDMEGGADLVNQVPQLEEQEQESEDELLAHSVGVELNQRLLAATEARARGEEAVLDADWEQWLKEAVERGTIPSMVGVTRTAASPSQMHWGQTIPEVFRYGPGMVPPPYIASMQTSMPPPPMARPVVSATRAFGIPSTATAPGISAPTETI